MKTTYYPKPEILERPELKQRHAVIEASAGTGKTFTLEHLVLDLIISGKARVEEILVVTFTDAATRELRERVRSLIRQVCDSSMPEKADCPGLSQWEVDEAARSRLREALFRFDGAAISTIHGFCQRVLSEQSFLGGRLFEQEHVNGEESFGFAFREEMRLALAEEGPVGDYTRYWIEKGNTLEELQSMLFRCHREGCTDRCPVTPAWAPGGLTAVINSFPSAGAVKEAGDFIFNNKRTISAYDNHIDELYEAARIASDAEQPEAAELFSAWAYKQRSLDGEKGCQIDNLRRTAAKSGAAGALKELVAKLDQAELISAPAESFFAYHLLPRVQVRLKTRKTALGLFDYDDMLLGVLEAISGRGAEPLLKALRKRWKCGLVDEFQDTDNIQWEIFRKIFVESDSGHRLFVIGDPKQAIYSFRGADVHTYKLARSYLTGNKGAGLLSLDKSYRSTGAMVDAVNSILTAGEAEERPFFSGLNRYDTPVSCGDLTRIALEQGRRVSPVQLIRFYSDEGKLKADTIRNGLFTFIAEEILRLTDPVYGLKTGSGNAEPAPIGPGDIYVLTRTGNEARQVGLTLRAYGIPHSYYKQEGLFQSPEAENVYRLLCAVDNPFDQALKMSAWLTRFFELPLGELPAWRDSGIGQSLTAMLINWKQAADARAWSSFFDQLLTESGLVRRLIFRGEDRALTNYLHLFELLLAEAYSRPAALAELIRWFKALIEGRREPEGREGNIQRLESERDAVQILTMHKAKGLEAEVVFIAGGFSSSFGSYDKLNIYHNNNRRHLHIGRAGGEIAAAITRDRVEEEQRLLYVALTRARSKLYLPCFSPLKPGPGDPAGREYDYKSLSPVFKALQVQLDLILEKEQSTRQGGEFALLNVPVKTGPAENNEANFNLSSLSLAQIPDQLPSSEELAGKLEQDHRGVILTSFTRIKQAESWKAYTADVDSQNVIRVDDIEGEAENELLSPGKTGIQAEPPSDSTLPGGRETGLFLHSLLEETPPAEIAPLSLEEWTAQELVQRRALSAARRYGFGEKQIACALALTYKALNTPVFTKSEEGSEMLEIPAGFSSVNAQCREMSFAYPIPEAEHLQNRPGKEVTEQMLNHPYAARRGFLQGLIDLVFEYRSRYYLLDWKSDRLPRFDREALSMHIKNNYSLQAQIYTFAVLRLLEINSERSYNDCFGGIIYAFIRGIGLEEETTPGIWFSKPPWAEIEAWERELLKRGSWGGPVIGKHGERSGR